MTSSPPAPESASASGPYEIAIVGAGIAGCAAARQLLAYDRQVLLLDRGRRPGGRASANSAGFDYGVPAFAAKAPEFLARVHQWQQAGLVTRWQPNARRWVRDCEKVEDLPAVKVPSQWTATQSFAGIVAAELAQVAYKHNTIVQSIAFSNGHWTLGNEQDHCVGRAAQLLLAMPAEQARRLLSDAIQSALLPIDRPTKPMSIPQWVAMLEFEKPVCDTTDLILFDEHPVLTAAWCESRKPGGSATKWIVHSQPAWAQVRLNIERDTIAEQLFATFKQAIGHCPLIMSHRAHRWTFSRPREPLGNGPLVNNMPPVTLCGDWCADGTVEGAWLSGNAAAKLMAGGE